MLVYVRMLYILVLCPVLLAASVLTLTIDSQLGTSVEDCFERVSIGEQLSNDATYRNVTELTTKECEQICKQDKQCQAYDYGVGAKGNATCSLSKFNESEIKESKIQRNPDYDVYIRRVQCDQKAPVPIEHQFDDPEEGPSHRPVFRPQEEYRRPYDDLRPFETIGPEVNRRPSYSQIQNDRPDDFSGSRPDIDRPPSYGVHKPQDIPFRPDRPYNFSRPGLNDENDYQKPYKRPQNWRPDPYYQPQPNDEVQDVYGPKPQKPNPPNIVQEQPQYQYIIRPNRKPPPIEKPNDQPLRPYPEYTSSYGQESTRPDPVVSNNKPYKPTRPYDKPSYSYNSQYASNYGTNSDDPIYVEIYDPPRPYRPIINNRPYYDTSHDPIPSFEYGNIDFSGQNYPMVQSDGYGSPNIGTQNEQPAKPYRPLNDPINTDDRYKPIQKPLKPSISNQNSQNSYNQASYGGSSSNQYGSSQSSFSDDEGYGNQNQYIGNRKPVKPLNSNQYSQHNYVHASYGENSSNQQYGSNQGSYTYDEPDSQNQNGYQSQSQTTNNQYGSTQNDYSQSNSYSSHGTINSDSQSGYGTVSSNYGNSQSSRPNSNDEYGSNQSYGNKPADSYYGTQSSSQGYGSGENTHKYQDSFDKYGSSYASQYYSDSQNGIYGSHLGYGLHQLYGIKPGSYGFGPNKFQNNPNNRPVNDYPSYGSYGLKPLNDKLIYDQDQPIKPNNQYSQNGNHGDRPVSDKPLHDQDIGSSHKRPLPNRGGTKKPLNDDIQEPTKPNQPNSSEYSDRPDVKPVYENEGDKPDEVPSYIVRPNGDIITSRPVAVGDFGERSRYRSPGESYKACFRRVIAGKRALRSHVRRVVDCERLEDCTKECATERRFPCESFNYRLDRTFRGKGLCELMTKPIEAFDLRSDFVEDKDYDFFEIDRNTLEPYCPETLRGPGLLHSGFLSSKPSKVPENKNQLRDRVDQTWSSRYRETNYDRFYDRSQTNYNRRYENHIIPYQIGISRSDEDLEDFGQYGGTYGGYSSYYKNRNDYHKSAEHWKLTDLPYQPSYYGVSHYGNTKDFDYYSLGKNQWKNYGYGYGKSNQWNNSESHWYGLDYEPTVYESEPKYYEAERRSDDSEQDCSSRRHAGMSLGTGAIRRSLYAHSVVVCESACFNERDFKCVSYSYKYSSPTGSDNCFLSERPYRGLDMSTDTDSDVYAMPVHVECSTINTKPWVESECFWHVRSGAAVDGTAIRAALTVSGLGACEAECIRAHAFFCRGFSFRFEGPTIGDDLENCLLTSSPPTSLEKGRGLRTNSGHELYSRGNYGRGCEPALYDVHSKETQCYLQYETSARLRPGAVSGRAHSKGQQECARACAAAPFRCLSFSFSNIIPPDADNCLLSEIRLFDLQRDVDYEHSPDNLLFAFDLFNSQCSKKTVGKENIVPSLEIPRPLSAIDDTYPGTALSGPEGPPEIYIPSSGPSGYKPYSSTGPNIKSHYKPIGPIYRPTYLPGPPEISGPSGPTGPIGPIYKPSYQSDSDFDSGFKPSYPPGPDFDSGFKPSYPPGPDYDSSFKPSYPARPSSYRPYKPTIESDYRPSYLPSGPSKPVIIPSDYRPSYLPSGPSKPVIIPSDYRPSYLPSGPSKPVIISSDYRPSYIPSGPSKPAIIPSDYRPSYIPSGYRPGNLPSGPNKPIAIEPALRPSYSPSGPIGPIPRPYYGSNRNGKPYIDATQLPSRPSRPGYGEDENLVISWSHYTVSGFPCRKGTTCAENHVAGHWACEPEGGDIGSWDYCCAPTHRCGYSEGFQKPWCYVGPLSDQWRPCSEKYYPYHQHKVPHPLQGQREAIHPRPDRPIDKSSSYVPEATDRYYSESYLPEADRKYWDDLYKNGPQAYYDKYGNPLPGYSRVPTESRPHIKYQRNTPRPSTGNWVPVPSLESEDELPPASGGLGVPRYWPVAYLHKGPPPNVTYFRYNQSSTERYDLPNPPLREPPEIFKNTNTETTIKNDLEARTIDSKEERGKNIDINDNLYKVTTEKSTTTAKAIVTNDTKTESLPPKEALTNTTSLDTSKAEKVKIDADFIKGIDDKLQDFTKSIEIYDIDDAKDDKKSNLRTLEAEERQIEALGRLLASRRGSKLIIEKRSQKDLESKSIALDKDFTDFNFGNRFQTSERKGVVQRVTKEEIEKEKLSNDKSLEVSETTYVRPPRVLSTTENIRKAIINGKVFYDATIRDHRELFSNTTRKPKSLRLEDNKALTIIPSVSAKKNIRARNTNPVRRVRRVYKKRYNPEEVRRRLLEREKNKNSTDVIS